MLHEYQPGQAVNEYQAQLAAQKAADKTATQYVPASMVPTYDLKSRVPEWSHILSMGANRIETTWRGSQEDMPAWDKYEYKGELGVYSTQDLLKAAEWLDNPIGYSKSIETHFTINQQRFRVQAELATRF